MKKIVTTGLSIIMLAAFSNEVFAQADKRKSTPKKNLLVFTTAEKTDLKLTATDTV